MTDQQAGWGQQPGWAPPPAPKPGVIPLRPLGLGEILEGAISYIRANPKVTLGLSAMVITLTQLVQLPGQYLYYSSLARPGFYPGAPTTDVAGELRGGLAFLLGGAVSLVAITLLAGILIVVMSRAVLGWRTDLRQAWTAVQPRLLGLLGLILLTWLLLSAVVFAAIVLIVLAGVAVAVVGAPSWVIAVMALVAVPAVLCALIYIWVALAMAPPTYILEQVGVVDALRRSRRLVDQTWWRVFGILLLVGALSFVISSTFVLVGTVIGGEFPGIGGAFSADGTGFAPPSLAGLLITAVCASIAGTITTPVTVGVTCLLYVDQRIRREAWNLELARAAYGGPPEAGPQPNPAG